MTTTGPGTAPIDPTRVRSALRVYRVLAFIAGIALFVLIAAMIVKYGPPKHAEFSAIWSPIHGLIYMAYAGSIAWLGFSAGWSLKRMVLNMLTGFVPVLPWVAEARVTRSTQEQLARLESPAGSVRR